MRFKVNLASVQNIVNWYIPAAIACFLIMLVSRFILGKTVHGLDYGLYFPDGVHYAYKTLRYLDSSEIVASNNVISWFSAHSLGDFAIDPKVITEEHNPVGHIVKYRIFYSIISVPFVYLLGMPGMLLAPIILTALIYLYVTMQGKSTDTKIVTLGVLIVLGSSFTFPRWMISNLTDPILACLLLLFVPILKISNQKAKFVALLSLILATSLTRFSLLFLLVVAVALIKRKEIINGVFVAFASVIAAIPTLLNLSSRTNAQSTSTGEASITLLDRLMRAIRVIVVEVGQLILLDPLLLMLILTGIYFSLKNFNVLESQLFVGFLISGTLLDCYVGEVGVNLRYQLPALVVLPLVIQVGFHKSTKQLINLLK